MRSTASSQSKFCTLNMKSQSGSLPTWISHLKCAYWRSKEIYSFIHLAQCIWWVYCLNAHSLTITHTTSTCMQRYLKDRCCSLNTTGFLSMWLSDLQLRNPSPPHHHLYLQDDPDDSTKRFCLPSACWFYQWLDSNA